MAEIGGVYYRGTLKNHFLHFKQDKPNQFSKILTLINKEELVQ